MAQEGRGDFEGKLDRTFPRIFRYDAGPNIGTLRQKPKKTVKKKTRSGNIGRTSMKDFRSSGAIMGQTNIGKKMTPTYKPKIQNQKEDGLLSKIYKALSTKSTSYDPTVAGLGGSKFAQRKGGGLIGNQKKLDMNRNGRIDAEDFKLLKKKKKRK